MYSAEQITINYWVPSETHDSAYCTVEGDGNTLIARFPNDNGETMIIEWGADPSDHFLPGIWESDEQVIADALNGDI